MPFADPIVWREPRDHLKTAIFCMTMITAFSQFYMRKIENSYHPLLSDLFLMMIQCQCPSRLESYTLNSDSEPGV
jgi:hypothetical protein